MRVTDDFSVLSLVSVGYTKKSEGLNMLQNITKKNFRY